MTLFAQCSCVSPKGLDFIYLIFWICLQDSILERNLAATHTHTHKYEHQGMKVEAKRTQKPTYSPTEAGKQRLDLEIRGLICFPSAPLQGSQAEWPRQMWL